MPPETDDIIPLTGLLVGLVGLPAWWLIAALLDLGVNTVTVGTALVLAVAVWVQHDVRRHARARNPEAREATFQDLLDFWPGRRG